MGGVTPHGIRYPDGASKAKNLGPELKTMAEDIGDVFTDTTSNGPWREIVEGIAEDAVDDVLADINVVRAYPETPAAQTTLAQVPMQWTYKTLNAPVPANVTQNVEGSWVGATRRRGEVPVLDEARRLQDSQIPTSIARLSDIPDASDVQQQSLPDRVLSMDLPIFSARLATAKTTEEPCAVVFTGSSTTYYVNPGFVVPLAQMIQETWRQNEYTAVHRSNTASFTERTTPGVHVYNAGQSGATANSYLNDEESDRIAALNPAVINHMVGSNDWKHGVSTADYQARLVNRLDYLDSVVSKPCQHVLVHQYERRDNIPGSVTWAQYLDVLNDIAATRSNVVVLDLSAPYRAAGAPTPDPLDLISSDNIHQTAQGYNFMVALYAAFYFAA